MHYLTEEVDIETLVQLENLLRYCDENGIDVIGFLAPYAPSVYDEMISSGNYCYLEKIAVVCNDLFKRYDFEIFDYANGLIGEDDTFYIDGFHGGEVVYGKMLLDMAEKGKKVRNLIDFSLIKKLIDNRYNGVVFYNLF